MKIDSNPVHSFLETVGNEAVFHLVPRARVSAWPGLPLAPEIVSPASPGERVLESSFSGGPPTGSHQGGTHGSRRIRVVLRRLRIPAAVLAVLLIVLAASVVRIAPGEMGA